MNLLKSFSIYTFVGFFSAGVGFLIMPVLTHYLSPKDYGIIALINSYVAFLVPFMALRTTGFIFIEKFNKQLSSSQFRSLFSSVSLFPFILFSILFTTAFYFDNRLSQWLSIPTYAIKLLPVLALFSIYRDLLSNYLTLEKKAKLYGVVSLSRTVVEIGLTLFFVAILDMNWQGRIESWLIALLLFFLYAVYYFGRSGLISNKVQTSYIKQSLFYGAPLIFHYLSKIIMNQSDKIFISKMVSTETLGIYTTGYQIGSIILILAGAFMSVYNPFVYERLSGENNLPEKLRIVKISYLFLASVFFVLIIISFGAVPFFELLIDPKYLQGAQYVFWVGLGYLFWAVYLVFSVPIFYFKKTKVLAYLAVLNVGLNLIFNYFFITFFGAIGAAYATALSFFIVSIIVIIIANGIYKLPWLKFRLIYNV